MGDELRVRLHRQAPLPEADLRVEDGADSDGRPAEAPAPGEVRLRVEACGVCRTDLHIVEGDVPAHRLPVTLGHQVVGRVEAVGSGVALAPGTRVGVGWLASACGTCSACRSGRENLCPEARFTGYDVDGGYATTTTARADFTYPLPDALGEATAVAPLLCGGVIGYRALRLAGVLDRPGGSAGQPIESGADRPLGRLLLVGFGNSASISLQVARGLGWECHVATRSETHRAVARELGASWVGEEPDPDSADAAIVFAPAGRLVPVALRAVVPGGTVACAGITMTDIPSFPYRLLYRERVLRSVANATRRDALELLDLAARIGIRSEVETFPLREARTALGRLAASELRASAVLVPQGRGFRGAPGWMPRLWRSGSMVALIGRRSASARGRHDRGGAWGTLSADPVAPSHGVIVGPDMHWDRVRDPGPMKPAHAHGNHGGAKVVPDDRCRQAPGRPPTIGPTSPMKRSIVSMSWGAGSSAITDPKPASR